MNDAPALQRGRPSLRRRLVAILSVPMLALLLLGGGLIYWSVLDFDRKEHDRALLDDARSVVSLLNAQGQTGMLSPDAVFLLSYESEGSSYFIVRSERHGVLGRTPVHPITPDTPVGAEPLYFDSTLAGQQVRGVSLQFHPRAEPEDRIQVTVAETMHSRERLAREVLLITLLLLGLLVVGLLLLVRTGVGYGLQSLQPLVEKLRRRGRDGGGRRFDPLTDADVPREILPLTQTIDGLFRRLRETFDLQEHFIADAAHQLRTPLAGLLLHVERARSLRDPDALRTALEQIEMLTARAARTSNQLLALMRAQSAADLDEPPVPLDLAALAVETVSQRVPDGLRAGVDLGYKGPHEGIIVTGLGAALRDMLENLIDNAILYAGRGQSVTVSVETVQPGQVELAIEDDGPGVPDLYLHRLGERFFRVPGSGTGGSGLGLAIVRRIVDRHEGSLQFRHGAQGGLRVNITLPARGSLSP